MLLGRKSSIHQWNGCRQVLQYVSIKLGFQMWYAVCECIRRRWRPFAVCFANGTLCLHSHWSDTAHSVRIHIGSLRSDCKPSMPFPKQTTKGHHIPCMHSHTAYHIQRIQALVRVNTSAHVYCAVGINFTNQNFCYGRFSDLFGKRQHNFI